jgi:cyclophilin family peptidyl-prolyl cis-trans isomerase
VQSTSTTIDYNINVIDVLDIDLTGFFMLVGNSTGASQTLKTAGASTKIKILGEVFSNVDTVSRTITTLINDKTILSAQTIGVNQGCLAMLNQGKTINSSQTYKITSSSTNVKYLIFGYEG